jgi:methylitaconate Delta-isomerase
MNSVELEQVAHRCVITRSGASRTVLFRSELLPAEHESADAVILAAMGTGDPRQIGRLRGANQFGHRDAIAELDKEIEVSIVDIVQLAVLFGMTDIGLRAQAAPSKVSGENLERFVAVRRATPSALGLDSERGLSRPAAVDESQSYPNLATAGTVAAAQMSFVGRWVGKLAPLLRVRKAVFATGAICAAVAAKLSGSVVNEVARFHSDALVRIGHPSGVFPCRIKLRGGEVQEVSVSRTARRVAEGGVYVRRHLVGSS